MKIMTDDVTKCDVLRQPLLVYSHSTKHDETCAKYARKGHTVVVRGCPQHTRYVVSGLRYGSLQPFLMNFDLRKLRYYVAVVIVYKYIKLRNY